MRVYHTSNVIVSQPDVCHSRKHLDFGTGFYLTPLEQQARDYGQRFIRRGEPAIMNIFDTVDLYLQGIYTREQALDQLQWKKPNHQLCITSQQVIDCYLHFVQSITL